MKASNVIRFPLEPRRVRPKTVSTLAFPSAAEDPLLERMKERGLPLTREMWLELNYPDGVPDPLPGELEAAIPDELR